MERGEDCEKIQTLWWKRGKGKEKRKGRAVRGQGGKGRVAETLSYIPYDFISSPLGGETALLSSVLTFAFSNTQQVPSYMQLIPVSNPFTPTYWVSGMRDGDGRGL